MSVVNYKETAPNKGNHARNSDPVLQLAHARDQAFMLWGETQRQAGKIVGVGYPEAGGGPPPEVKSSYTEAHRGSMYFLDRVLEIESQLYDTTATTPEGLIFQAVLLREAVFPSDHEGRRLLNSIISGIERICIKRGPETHKLGSDRLTSHAMLNP